MTRHEQDPILDKELNNLRKAFVQVVVAIQNRPDITNAWDATNKLSVLTRELQRDAADFRSYFAARLLETKQVTISELAAFLGVTTQRVSQMISRAAKRGNPVKNPGTTPEQPHVALGVITSDKGVLIARRRDGIPPWTFPGGEMQPEESLTNALQRLIHKETGLTVTDVAFIGRRIHPKTSRVMVYGHAHVEPGEPVLGDPEDLSEVRWATIDETRTLMPDMYPPVRQYLDELYRV